MAPRRRRRARRAPARPRISLAFACRMDDQGVKYLSPSSVGFEATVPSRVHSVSVTVASGGVNSVQIVIYGPSSEEVAVSRCATVASAPVRISLRTPSGTDFGIPAVNEKWVAFKVLPLTGNTNNYHTVFSGTLNLQLAHRTVAVVAKLKSEEELVNDF